jgi:heptosyltransferase-2
MSLPALRALHERFPHAEINVLARPWVAELYAGESSVTRVIPYTAASGFHDLSAKWKAARALRRERFDLIVLFQNAFEAAAVSRLAGAQRIIGYDRDGRGWLLSTAVPVPRRGEIPEHERFYYLELLRRSGLIEKLPESEAIRLEGAERASEAGRARFAALGIHRPVIGVSPGAAYGTAKQWLPERFAEAASTLASRLQADVCLFGTKTERSLCEQVARMFPNVNVHNFAGQTSLGDFIELAAACHVFLTNDSGSMHIVSALGVPSVTVFGSTNPVTTGPTGPSALIVREPPPCSPCLLRECPIDHRCMTAIQPARVVEAAERAIALKN